MKREHRVSTKKNREHFLAFEQIFIHLPKQSGHFHFLFFIILNRRHSFWAECFSAICCGIIKRQLMIYVPALPAGNHSVSAAVASKKQNLHESKSSNPSFSFFFYREYTEHEKTVRLTLTDTWNEIKRRQT